VVALFARDGKDGFVTFEETQRIGRSGKAEERFQKARNRFGAEWRVEFVFVDDHYGLLTRRWPMALAKARSRIASLDVLARVRFSGLG
jgi:hypothetical protein